MYFFREYIERSDFISSSETQIKVLRHYYDMMYPNTLKPHEYIRLIAIRRNPDGKPITQVNFVRNFEEYKSFIEKYRYTHDVYNQIATNRHIGNGTKSSQRMRKVIFIDFDQKDYPDLHTAMDFTNLIHEKLPKLFIHACVSSGHGFHFYVSIKPNCNITETVETNWKLVSILGADLKAVSPTQICRPPCTYNHKQPDGTYDYKHREKWRYVTVVNNAYQVGSQFKYFTLQYIQKQIQYYEENQKACKILEKIEWDYQSLNDYPCYLCIQKIMNEGTVLGQRNFWHGRIVKMLQMEGHNRSKIHSACQEYNRKCRPPKSKEEIEKDTDRFLENDYKLLGCYKSFPEGDKHRKWVEAQCDEVYCRTYHNGAKISIQKGDAARINKKVLTNRNLRTLTGNEYLIITLLDVYKNSFGRRGFRIRNLKGLLHSSIRKKQCISDRLLKELLIELTEKRWIEVVPDSKQPKKWEENHLKLTRRLKEFEKGYIEFYFSIAGALIDGRISQKEYIVFITLVRNLSDKKSVSYDQLAEDLDMDKHNIRKYIKKLQDERCLVIQKDYSEDKKEFNKYTFINAQTTDYQSSDNLVPFSKEEAIKKENTQSEDGGLVMKLLS